MLVAWACVSSPVAEQQAASLSPGPDAASSTNTTTFKALSLKEINRIYETGTPSNIVRRAGLVVHMKDDTEQFGPGGLVHPGGRQFQEFWATSIVNKNMPGLYKDSCGVIIAPQAVDVMCSFPKDYELERRVRKGLPVQARQAGGWHGSLELQKAGAGGYDEGTTR